MTQCVVPENIHIPTTEGIRNSRGVRGVKSPGGGGGGVDGQIKFQIFSTVYSPFEQTGSAQKSQKGGFYILYELLIIHLHVHTLLLVLTSSLFTTFFFKASLAAALVADLKSSAACFSFCC